MKTLTRFASALCVMSAIQAVYAGDSVTIPLNDNKDTTFSISLTNHVGNQWTYQVNKVKGRDLSHWDLLVPSCIGHFSNYTSGAEIGKDGSIQDRDATGIKWNTTGGTFSFTLDANYPSTQVDVLAKSSNGYAVKTITGPDCTSVPTPPVVEEPTPPVVEEPTPPVVEEPTPPVVEEPTPPVVEEPTPPVVEEPPVDEPTIPDDSNIGDISDDNMEPQWATTWDGSFYGGDEIVCSLDTNYSVAEKDWWEPQWITVSGWLQLRREGYTGALKAKVITTGHVVNPQSSVIRGLTNEGVSCPSELPDCVGEAGKQYIVYQDGSYDSATGTVTSDDNGRIEFTAKAWWPGITQGYLTAMDDINPNDWNSVKDYVVENHYGVYLRGEGASLLTQVSNANNNSGKDIYWYPDDRCPKPAVDRYGELAVLANFDAYQMVNGHVCLKWKTSMELDNAGFNILRAEHDANLIDNEGYFNIIQVNSRLISSKSSTSLSSESYAYIDKTPEAGVVNYYGIEDIDFNQIRTIHKEFITTPKPCQGETCSSCKAD